MVPFLRGQELLGYVDGSIPCPVVPLPRVAGSPADHAAVESTGGSTAAAAEASQARPAATSTGDYAAAVSAASQARAAWLRQDQAVLSLLISSLSKDVMHHAIGKQTSRLLWIALEQSLGSSTRTRALSLLTQFQALRQGDASITDYLGRARILVEDLALAGRPVSLDDQNLYVFRGLRPKFRPFVAGLTRGAPVTLTELSDYLTAQEFICADEYGGAAVPVAMAAQRGGRAGSQPQQQQFSSRGGGSGGRGRHRGRGRGRGRGGVRCQICNAGGHSAVTCYRRYTPSPAPQAHVAYSADGDSLAPHHWLPDTGASAHATPKASLMSTAADYTGLDSLRVGDGTGSFHTGGSI